MPLPVCPTKWTCQALGNMKTMPIWWSTAHLQCTEKNMFWKKLQWIMKHKLWGAVCEILDQFFESRALWRKRRLVVEKYWWKQIAIFLVLGLPSGPHPLAPGFANSGSSSSTQHFNIQMAVSGTLTVSKQSPPDAYSFCDGRVFAWVLQPWIFKMVMWWECKRKERR